MKKSNQAIALSYLRHAPFSLCLREFNRLLAMESLDNQFSMQSLSPVLDVGCGDAFWWTVRNSASREIYGVDVANKEVMQAKKHINAIVADISAVKPFPDIKFQQIIGNCSLEHVRHIHLALQNIKAVAADNAKLVLIVPTLDWAFQGLIQKFLLKYFPRIAMSISGLLNGFFQHWHLYDSCIWKSVLEQQGWKVIDIQGIGNRRSEFLFRLFLPTSFISFIVKKVTGFYPNRLLRWAPAFILSPFSKLLLWSLQKPLINANSKYAYESVIIAEVSSE